jgi:hypothetical protein
LQDEDFLGPRAFLLVTRLDEKPLDGVGGFISDDDHAKIGMIDRGVKRFVVPLALLENFLKQIAHGVGVGFGSRTDADSDKINFEHANSSIGLCDAPDDKDDGVGRQAPPPNGEGLTLTIRHDGGYDATRLFLDAFAQSATNGVNLTLDVSVGGAELVTVDVDGAPAPGASHFRVTLKPTNFLLQLPAAIGARNFDRVIIEHGIPFIGECGATDDKDDGAGRQASPLNAAAIKQRKGRQ